MHNFDKLCLNKQINRALVFANFSKPTIIQHKIIPHVLNRNDVLGVAQTGTGKTAAYILPIIHNITLDTSRYQKKSCKTIIIAPTRELATQVFENAKLFSKYLSIRLTLIVGGVKPKPQLKSLEKGVDIIVGTPGRIMDHIRSGGLTLSSTKTIVLDEADQMLDLGFMPDIKKIHKSLPKQRQTIFMTATMLDQVKNIALNFLNNHKEVNLSPKATPIEKIKQKVILVKQSDKLSKLKAIIEEHKIFQSIIFTRTKKRADNLAKALCKNDINSASFHGDKRQSQRNRILNSFKVGKLNFLIATDIAARGIDIKDIMFIINYDLPMQPEIYVHRVGRSARAGKEGTAISFCDSTEKNRLKDIEKLIGYKLKSEVEKSLDLKKSNDDNSTVKKKRTIKNKPFFKKKRSNSKKKKIKKNLNKNKTFND